MIYADETYYKEKYLYGREPTISVGFLFYAKQASNLIDMHTFNRVKTDCEYMEAVKQCCCEIAELLYADEDTRKEKGAKSSERIGSYSVSYESASGNEQNLDKKIKQVVLRYLGHTELCYKGV